MKTLIITGGAIEDSFAVRYVKEWQPDYILAADKGMEFCYRAGIEPACIIGDYDSADENVLAYFREKGGIEWHDYNPEKDYTDTEIAVELAIAKKSSAVHIIGATGTRLDHVIGNIQLLSKLEERNIEGRIIDPNNRIRLVRGRAVLDRESQFGTYVSLLPLTTKLNGVTLKGFKYPLANAKITSDNTLGVSNEIIEKEAVVTIEDGIGILIESRDA